MSISTDIIAMVEEVSRRIAIPPVRHLHIPPLERNPSMDAEFGLIALEDGSAGFFYAWLGDTLERMRVELNRDNLVRESAVELSTRFASNDEVERTIGLGAINAVSQHVFRRAGYQPALTTTSMGRLTFAPKDHVGMVGLFPSLARRLTRDGIRLTVIEKRSDAAGDGFRVTLDPTELEKCNKVLCTASTLLNDTLEEILTRSHAAERIALIGPTASCLPDPVFARGVDIVGGSVVLDLDALLERLCHDEPWGESVCKYTIARREYPGFAALLSRL